MVRVLNRIKRDEPNNWTPGSYDKTIIVLHETVTRETGDGAETVAGWFADPTFDASTQYVVDNRDVIQCVPERAYAWSAGTTANRIGIHVELVSMANQSARQWADAYSTAELQLAADLVRELCAKHNIPARQLGTADLRAGRAGITGHYNVSYAWRESTHEDVDPAEFPWRRFMRMVRNGADESEEDDDMPTAREVADEILDTPLNVHDPDGRRETRSVTVREKLVADVLEHEATGSPRVQDYMRGARKSKAPR